MTKVRAKSDVARPGETLADAIEAHRATFDVSWARRVLRRAMDRELDVRISMAVREAIDQIAAEADRERNRTLLDFTRIDIREGVQKELNTRGFHTGLNTFRSTNSDDGDAVLSLEVWW